MRTKSVIIRECLRCQHGKQVLRDVIAILEKRENYFNTDGLVRESPCRERLGKILAIVERAWYPLEEWDTQIPVYGQSVLMDMLAECRLYEEMRVDAEKQEGRVKNKGKWYTINASEIVSAISSYWALLSKDWVSGERDDEAREEELEVLIPTIKRLIIDFSNINYTDQFLEYREKQLSPKSGEPQINTTVESCRNSDTGSWAREWHENLMEYVGIASRVVKLPKNYQDLFWSAYDKAPTSFGVNLSVVMDEKAMSAHDIYLLVKPYAKNKNIRMSVIQSMMKCRYPTDNTDLIPYIARALLVEESVLYSGVGKSWGTWAYQLDTAFIKATMDNPNQRGMVSKIREDVREGIIEVIRSDESLHEYLKKVEDFPYPAQREIYAEETIHLHSDRRLRMCYLREKESLYILLSCLEEAAEKNG